MADEFKVGDLVQLKSGGPAMTVTGKTSGGMLELYTKWFAGAKLETGHFPVAALQTPAPKEAKKA